MTVSNKELKTLVGGGGIKFTTREVIVEGLTIAQTTALDMVGVLDADNETHWDLVEKAVKSAFDEWLEGHDDALLESYGLKKATLPKEFDME